MGFFGKLIEVTVNVATAPIRAVPVVLEEADNLIEDGQVGKAMARTIKRTVDPDADDYLSATESLED